MQTTKILLVDDHAILREGLRLLLEKAGLNVVGEAADGREAIANAREMKADLVVMDIAMPDLNGIDATRKLIGELPGTKVVALSMNSDRRNVVQMFQAGALGYVLKSSASAEIVRAVQAVGSGQTYVSPSIGQVVIEALSGGATAGGRGLSNREREVLQLLAEGKSSKEIALQLALAVPTVETYRRQIMDKLGLRTIAELTKHAVREGLTTLE